MLPDGGEVKVTEAPFHYYEFDPAPALARHVTSYWAFRARGAAALPHRIWPDGCTSLAWILPRSGRPLAVLTGPHLRAHDVMVEPGTEYWGARFWPDAGGAVTGIAAPEPQDSSPELEELRLRREQSLALGGAEAVARHHTQGRLTIRVPDSALVDTGSVQGVGRVTRQ
jgi:hypothetical protein